MKLMHNIARSQILLNQQMLQIESNSKNYSDLTTVQFECLDERIFKDQYNFSKQQVLMVRERLEIDILIKLELLDKLSYPIKNKRLQTTYGLHKSVIIGIINYLLEHINTHFGHTIMLRPCKRMVSQSPWQRRGFK